jgi:hypothetical protein
VTFEQRFWAKVEVGEPDECWPWVGARNSDGYGVIRTEDGLRLAHRVSVILDGRDPTGAVAKHSCDTTYCVNPRHLAVGTQAENMRECAERGRNNRGSRNGQALLDEPKVREILALAATESRATIAARFGVSKETVRDILTGRSWRHVTAEAA